MVADIGGVCEKADRSQDREAEDRAVRDLSPGVVANRARPLACARRGHVLAGVVAERAPEQSPRVAVATPGHRDHERNMEDPGYGPEGRPGQKSGGVARPGPHSLTGRAACWREEAPEHHHAARAPHPDPWRSAPLGL